MRIKKGELLIRDVVFLVLILSTVLVFASTYVDEMASNYGDTTLQSEYSLSNLSMTRSTGLFGTLRSDINETADSLTDEGEFKTTQVFNLAGKIITTFFTAPNRIGDLVYDSLVDVNVDAGIAETIKWVIVIGLWIAVIFALATAFLSGAKV